MMPGSRGAIVAPTFSDARDTCIEGNSGLLSVIPWSIVASWNRSLGELVLTNGSRIKLFSAEEPNRLRGPQFHWAWGDELAAWKYEDALDQLLFGLRLGDRPQACITTTPRPNPITQRVIEDPGTVITRGSTFDNREHLSEKMLADLRDRFEGTRLGRQELYGELLEDVLGAFWTRQMIEDACRPPEGGLPPFVRVGIGVDPSGSDGETGDQQGIIAAARGKDGRAYVLEDGSTRKSPDEWGRDVVNLYDLYKGDLVVAERNYGGAMVEAVIKTQRKHLNVKMVTATRGKLQRAEPVSAIYEQGKVTHLKRFPELEDQMCHMTSEGYVGRGSPDRVDALVWILTELMLGLGPARPVRVRLG